METYLIIQARTGSSRLPSKMILPFVNGKCLLEVLIEKLLNYFPKNLIIVTTTNSNNDDIIENISKRYGVYTYRGSENDVLTRFIDSAEAYNASKIIRICADNPFLIPENIKELINKSFGKDDYLSYCFPDKTPVIKTHIGLFGEYTTLETLKKVKSLTNEPIFREHVTNFIYTNPNLFRVRFLNMPSNLLNRKDIRLTIDTKEDFELAQYIYSKVNCLNNDNFLNRLLGIIDGDPKIRQIMNQQIKQNEK